MGKRININFSLKQAFTDLISPREIRIFILEYIQILPPESHWVLIVTSSSFLPLLAAYSQKHFYTGLWSSLIKKKLQRCHVNFPVKHPPSLSADLLSEQIP